MSTWILLRGLTRETRHWGHLPDALRESLGAASCDTSCDTLHDSLRDATEGAAHDPRLLLLDLPGNGEFAHLRAPATVAGMVAFVRQAAMQMGAPGPYSVLAMSLGGMVATDWAQRHPGEIERLVLINTSMRPFSRMHERLRPSAWLGLLGVAAHWSDAVDAESGIHRLTCNNVETLGADLDAWVGIRRSAPVSRANALRQLWAAARFTAAAAAPHCPLLILSSCADGLVNPVCSAKLAAAWGAAHREHPWAGHDLPHDDPAWTAAQIRTWLGQRSAEESARVAAPGAVDPAAPAKPAL
ncbi:alpha/beta fold hydrolase [Paraburkholderia susongensis]|uniref:Lysophospholipase, alpha-beta hydrolase superfamily n=1 Tax=Paraburkholderia susongensis TaxID=1515439 RepID=A0A1X7LB87_9BURK|nr:alpha/beta hydrolase [Paraburkholderia susongensis]SMG50970.1 Lysophospholipase, alpha-beta hydrolase superfamily [Paraburkholderia susongensis]